MDSIVTQRLSFPPPPKEPTDAEVDAAGEALAQLEAEARALGPTAPAAKLHHAMGRIYGEELGDLLYILAKLANQEGVDPEEALRAANAKFTRRFQALEQIAAERGWASLSSQPLVELEAAWREAKQRA